MRISSITKNAGKACNNRLYRHIRTFEKIVKNYFVICIKITDRHTLEVSAQIKTYNFDDANGNGTLDESEFDSAERYSVSYLNGREISAEEAASFEMGDYIYIDPALDLANLYTQLKTNEYNEK